MSFVCIKVDLAMNGDCSLQNDQRIGFSHITVAL